MSHETLNVRRAITGERRQISALFFDIVGSTQLLQILDPEDYAVLQGNFHTQALESIRFFGGYLDSLQGDGGSAFFGFPLASEDQAPCAVACALDLLTRCRSINEAMTLPVTLQIRVGVATGEMVIMETQDSGIPKLKDVIGITPTLAARIQQEAEPDTVVVSEDTYRLTSGAFDYERLERRALKGFDNPIPLWQPKSRRHRSRQRRPQAPLTGRDSELAVCRAYWDRAQAGSGQVLHISGDPGIGKSRLVADFAREVEARSCDAHVFQCVSRGNTRPLHPFVDALRQELDLEASEGVALEPDEVRRALVGVEAPATEESVEILAFLSGHDSIRYAIDGTSLMEAEERKRQALDTVLEVLVAWAERRPQLIVIEDFHWADTLTEALVAEMADRFRHKSIMVIVTERQEPAKSATRPRNVHALALTGLTQDSVPALVEALWGQAAPERLASFVYDRSDGVPLFVEELVTLLRERFLGVASNVADWSGALADSGIVSLRDLLAARLLSLGPAREVAQICSVVGREFSTDILERLVDGGGRSLLPALAQLEQARVIQRRGEDATAIYRFRHVLLQEAAYGSLLKTNRRAIHARIADLAASGAVSSIADEILAWHCEQAGRGFEAATYAVRAAEACSLRSAGPEAERLLAMAESCLESSTDSTESDQLMLQLLAVRGPVAIALYGKGSREARANYEKAIEICRRYKVEDRERWFPLYWGWWFTSPDRRIKRLRSEVLIRDLDHAVDAEVRLQACHCAWAANFHAGRYAVCLECIDKGLALYEPERGRKSRSVYGGHDAKVCGLGERAQLRWLTGDPAGADEDMRLALAWAGEIDHLGSLCHALDHAILLAAYKNDVAEVARLADRLASLAATNNLPEVEAKSRIFGGWAMGRSGSISEGLQALDDGLALQRSVGTDEDTPVYLGLRAGLLLDLARPDEALATVEAAIEEAERAGNAFWVPELYRHRGSISALTSPRRGAWIGDLDTAIKLASASGAATLARRAEADLVRLRERR